MALLARSRGRGPRTRVGVVLATVGTLLAFQALVATPATAAVISCTFGSGALALTVDAAAPNPTVMSRDAAGNILVNGSKTSALAGTGCATAVDATVANTTSINITGTGSADVTINLAAGSFGAINWTLVAPAADTTNDLVVTNATSTDGVTVVFGASGIDLNGDDDVDVTHTGFDTFVVNGGVGDDTISAAGSTATGAAFASPISLFGDTGDDTLTGGAGDDNITGGDGDDTVAGGAGNDTLDGGLSTGDTLDFSASTTAVIGTLNSLFSGQGVDTTTGFENLVGSPQGDTLTGDAGPNVITGGAGDDTLNGGRGPDTADYSDATAGVTVDLAAGTATGGAGNDTLSNFENVQGSDFDDDLTGDDADNELLGGAGADTLDGGTGADFLDGEAGVDTVDYGSRSDSVSVGLAIDTSGPTPGVCNDPVEVANGEPGEGDCITGVENAILGTGDDSFVGSAFANRVWPNGGQNVLNGDPAGGPATGGDVLDYSVGYETGVEVNMAGGATAGDSAIGFENAIGTAFADTFVGNEASNTLRTGAGNDSVRGGSGDDNIRGGAGKDVVRGGSGDDDAFGGKGNDTLTGGGGDDLLVGGGGKDLCRGGAGSDTIRGCEGKSKARAETRARVARLAKLG